MCGCIGNCILARAPIQPNSAWAHVFQVTGNRRRRSGLTPAPPAPPSGAHPDTPLVSPLLADSNRGVRIRAVALLATVSQPPADREPFERAAAEFVAAQRLNADRPEARSTLGTFLARRVAA